MGEAPMNWPGGFRREFYKKISFNIQNQTANPVIVFQQYDWVDLIFSEQTYGCKGVQEACFASAGAYARVPYMGEAPIMPQNPDSTKKL